MWVDEAALLPAGAGYVVARARVVGARSRWLAREYAVLDNVSVRAALAHPEVSVLAGRLVDGTVQLADGGTIDAPAVIDATGAARAGAPEPPDGRDGGLASDDAAGSRPTGGRRGGPARGRDRSPAGGGGVAGRRPGWVEQTAFGVLVPAEVAAPLVGPGEAVFMDWRQPLPGPATFLYAVPLPDGRVLLEETSLARRPGLPFADLRERLLARLATHGIDPGDAEVERVRFPVDPGPPAKTRGSRAPAGCPAPTRSRGAPLMPVYRSAPTEPGVARGLWTTSGREWRVVPFGAAAGIGHPATGYSVADSLRLAPLVADALVEGGPPAARRAVWSGRARAVHRLRRAGLHALLALGPAQTQEFFDLFFGLPADQQRAYLSGREDLAGTVAAMAGLFRAAPWSLRRVLARHSIHSA
jgi:lycopene beta-cyclase